MSDIKTIEIPLDVLDAVWLLQERTMPDRMLAPVKCTVVSMQITENKKKEIRHTYRLSRDSDKFLVSISIDDIGVTVFKTQEEAERAYKEYWYRRGEKPFSRGRCQDCEKFKYDTNIAGRCEDIKGRTLGTSCYCVNIIPDVY